MRRNRTNEVKHESAVLRFSNRVRGETLNLHGQRLGAADLPDVIALLKRNPSIKTVILAKNNIGPEGALYFAKHNTTATTVDLSDNGLGPQGALNFAKHNKVATTVNLSDNRLGPQGALDFAIHNKVATTVNLSDNNLGPQGALDFALHNSIASTVDLSVNTLGPKGALLFAQNNIIATSVSLANNRFGPDGVLQFAMHNKVATTVNLGSNQLGPEGALQFAMHNKVATAVNLCFNGLGSKGALLFAKHNAVATAVNLSFNNLGAQGVFDYVSHNTVANTVNLGENGLNSEEALRILNMSSMIKKVYFGTTLDNQALEKFLSTQKMTILHVDPSSSLCSDLLDRLDEHNERVTQYFSNCVWGGITFMQAFIQANQKSALRNSALPLISQIASLAGVSQIPLKKWENFITTPAFNGRLLEQQNISSIPSEPAQELKTVPVTIPLSLWTKMVTRLHRTSSGSNDSRFNQSSLNEQKECPVVIENFSPGFWAFLRKKRSSAATLAPVMNSTSGVASGPETTTTPLASASDSGTAMPASIPARYRGMGLGG